MISVVLFMDVLLFTLGIGLLFVLFSRNQKSPWLLRLVLLAYFIVVVEYNYQSIIHLNDKLLLAGAALSFMLWIGQTGWAPEAETEA
jgi:hypothetical protein